VFQTLWSNTKSSSDLLHYIALLCVGLSCIHLPITGIDPQWLRLTALLSRSLVCLRELHTPRSCQLSMAIVAIDMKAKVRSIGPQV